MRGYDRNEMYRTDDLDEYEEDGEEQEEEEVEDEYEEEQEDPKPTKEELEYLALRQKMKEAVRKKMKKENGASFGNSQVKKNKLPHDNYGSFFGPSQPVIAPRVIQESKSLLENQHLASRISNSSNGHIRKTPASTNSETRAGVREPAPIVSHEAQTKMKAQKLKDNRDYSFLLSEDAELPAPKKEPSARNVVRSNPDARSAQVQPKSRQSVSNHRKPSSSAREERRPVPTNRQTQTKIANYPVASGSRRPNMTSADTRKQLASNAGNGPGRPVGQKGLPSKMPAHTKPPVSNNKSSSLTMNKKPSFSGTKKPVVGMQKPPLSKLNSSVQRQHSEQRREVREPEKAKVNSKMSVASSKPQSNPTKKIQPRAPSQVDRPKKRPAGPYFNQDEEDDPRALIRQMFRYDPSRYVDEDDSDMEANFDDILEEERRSAKIAKEEDEHELRLIEEEEERERLRKEAKRRKLSQR